MDKIAREKCCAFLLSVALFLPLIALADDAPTANAGGAVTGSAATSSADTSRLERSAQEISETMMSPFCPGRTISSCPSPQARELRTQIFQWLQQGYSEEAVRNQLRTIYGEDVKGEPDKEGFGLVGWFAPLIFVLLALLLVVWKLRKMKVTSGAKPHLARKNKTDALEKLEAELKLRRMGKGA
ncbi:MAG: cytochrome c-type biogenesis protein CcmH [Bdellovibrionota bacterium]